jgi:hypothetical protein
MNCRAPTQLADPLNGRGRKVKPALQGLHAKPPSLPEDAHRPGHRDVNSAQRRVSFEVWRQEKNRPKLPHAKTGLDAVGLLRRGFS